MTPAERRNAQAAYVSSLPNYAEIRGANAPDLHYPGEVLSRFANEFIVLTPMNMEPPVSYMMLGRYDYVQEYFKFRDGGASWDDTSSNKAKVGDLFAFAFYQPSRNVDKMELFEVLDIAGAEHRRSNWVIAEHDGRRVLRLSRYLGKVSYSSFAAAKGYTFINEQHYPYVRGTVRTLWPKQLEVEIQGERSGKLVT